MSENVQPQNKMGTAKMLPLIFSMALPAMFSMMVQALYNIVDTYFVSQVSEKAMAAVSLAFPIQNLQIAFAVGTAVGVTSLISRRLGEGRKAEAESAASPGIVLGLCTAAVFAVYGAFFTTPFFKMFESDPEIVLMGDQYISVCCIFSFGSFVVVMLEKILQATGNMLWPMIFQLVGAVRPHAISISFKGFRPRWETIKNIYAVGLPAIVMQAIGTVMNMAMNGILSGFSTAAYTVFGLYFKLQSFVFMPVFGLTQGLLPIMGFNYGARNKKRLMQALSQGCLIALFIMLAGMLAFLLLPDKLLGIFNASEELLHIGVPALRTICTCFIFAALGIVSSTLFQAVGRGTYSLIVSIMRQLAVLVPSAWLLSRIFGEVNAVWWAFPVAETVSLLVSVFFFMRLYTREIKSLDKKGAAQ